MSHRQHVNALADPRLAAVGAGCCAVFSAVLLRSVDARPDAAWIVPVLLVWGALATVPAWSRPNWSVARILGVALVLRLLVVGSPPLLSDDVYRYLFEGLAMAAGHNPFTESPAQLHGLHDPIRDLVNHPSYTSIYPPVALIWFRLLALTGSIGGTQLLTALLDVGTCGLLIQALRQRDAPTWPALVYALHPLPIVEGAIGAHVDLVAAFFAAGALALPGAAATALAILGGGAKLLPFALLPATLRGDSTRRQLIAGLAATSILIVGAQPLWEAGPQAFTSFGTYTQHWRFNALTLPLVEPLVGGLTRPLLVALGAVIAAGAALKLRDPAELLLVVATAFLMLTPTVHPWYGIWALLPSLALGRWGWSLAATALMGSYAVLATLDPATGRWDEGPWLAAVTWTPALLALGAEAITRRRAQP